MARRGRLQNQSVIIARVGGGVLQKHPWDFGWLSRGSREELPLSQMVKDESCCHVDMEEKSHGAELRKSDAPWPTKGRGCHVVGHGGGGTGRAASWSPQNECMGSVIQC